MFSEWCQCRWKYLELDLLDEADTVNLESKRIESLVVFDERQYSSFSNTIKDIEIDRAEF